MAKEDKVYHTLEDVLDYFKNVEQKAIKEKALHKKRMRNLSLTDRINYNNQLNKQRRVMEAHEEIQKEWLEIREQVCSRANKKIKNSIFNHTVGHEKNSEVD